MRLTPKMKAALVAAFFAMGMASLWFNYHDFLTQGRRPPENTQILNKIETEGLPTFSVRSINGEELSLAKFAGRLVVLNFWASWCDPCIAEFPSLLKLVAKYKGEVVLFAISADYERADIDNFLKTFKVKDPNVHIAWDKDLNIAKKFGTDRLPESYIIGRDGRLVRKVAGIDDWASKDAIEFFDMLAGGSSSGKAK